MMYIKTEGTPLIPVDMTITPTLSYEQRLAALDRAIALHSCGASMNETGSDIVSNVFATAEHIMKWGSR